MRIKNIQIENYKGFEKCDVEFHPKVNVFIGANASGKTSLLKAILKTLSSMPSHLATDGSHPALRLTSSEINYSARSCSIVSLVKSFPYHENEEIPFVVSTTSDVFEIENFRARNGAVLADFWKQLKSQKTATIPIIKFYPANRGEIEYTSDFPHYIYSIPQLEVWQNIYQDSLSYSKFLKWFLDNETSELLMQRDAGDFGLQNPVLRDIRTAVNEAFKLMGYPDSKIKTNIEKREGNSERIPTLVIENKINNKNENLDNKSDGEKAIITLVADIAYNLSIAKDFTTGDDFLKSPGIVMIDEIETHLHPKWQRQIVPLLGQVFPNIQFFITTHSPQVVSSVASDSVYSLDNFQVQNVQLKTLGEDSNSLLKYIFNATDRPQPYIDLLREFDRLMEDNASYDEFEVVIGKIKSLEDQDDSQNISNLVSDLAMQLEAYKFDREHADNI